LFIHFKKSNKKKINKKVNAPFDFFSGLCSIFRSEAGGQTERFDGVDANDPMRAHYRNNSHWLKDGEASNFVAYYDATSLYPSSGE